MKLEDYIEQTKKPGDTNHPMVCALSEASRIGKTTIYNVLRNRKISRYPVAVRLSKATGGLVTVKELLKDF